MSERRFSTEGAQLTLYLDGPAWDDQPTAALGAFRAQNGDAARKLLDEAADFARARGITRLIGPMDGDTWHSYRFVTQSDGSAPFLLEPGENAVALNALHAAGFEEISRYFSARVMLDARTDMPAPPAHALHIETWDGSDPQALFGQVHDLSVEAFSGNAFYKPISRQAFLAMYMPIVPMIRRELIFFARHADGRLAGFLFGIPDYAQGPAPDTVILKTYASLAKGAGRALSHAFHAAAQQQGYRAVIHALIHDDNQSAQRSAAEGGTIFRRYGLFGRHLDG